VLSSLASGPGCVVPGFDLAAPKRDSERLDAGSGAGMTGENRLKTEIHPGLPATANVFLILPSFNFRNSEDGAFYFFPS